MNYDATEADRQAMHVIELLIQNGHYKGFHKEDVIKAIAKDANALSAAFTLKPEGDSGLKEFLESSQQEVAPDAAFPPEWTKTVEAENV